MEIKFSVGKCPKCGKLGEIIISNNPIVPGVCQVGMVGEVIALYTGKKLCLAYVKNIKYLKTMQPTEATDYDLTLHEVVPEGNGYKVIATFSTPEAAYAKLSLTFVSESV